MSIYADLRDKLLEGRKVAASTCLDLMLKYLQQIETASLSNSDLKSYVSEMHKLVKRKHFVHDGTLVNEFLQKFGEAHFMKMCLDHGINISKIPEGKKKTPDFRFDSDDCSLFFEVKTLSVVGGDSGLNSNFYDAVRAQIEIEEQAARGEKVRIGLSEYRPYGDRKSDAPKIVIDTLMSKVRQNVKSGQFNNDPTFLVLNLCMLPPLQTGPDCLRPYYHDDFMFSKSVSGELWMLAFASDGMLVMGCPEFEGKPCIQGLQTGVGILNDEEFENIAGILAMVYPLGNDASIYGLFRSKRQEDQKDCTVDVVGKLVGDFWNDEQDTNSWSWSSA